MSTKRFPFSGLPKGWFVVALSEDLEPGTIKSLRYFGRDLIAYRGESGQPHVVDAYCPHLGAHFGYGGKIIGETIRCPFHGWRFDGEGQCVEVPYSDRIPPKAKLDAWPVREQDGAIYLFYDPQGGEPWPLPAMDNTGWTPGKSVHWKGLTTHPQEVFENTVDTAHIGPVHDGRGATIVGKPEREAEMLTIDIEFQAPGDIVGMPGQLNDVHLHVVMRGLGHVHVETQVRNANVFARQRIYVTPIDEGALDIRGIVHVRESDDAEFTRELADLFYRAYVDDFAKDFPIWENKRYLERPTLAKGDGPIGIYRRWCTQFYGEASSSEVAEQSVAVRAPDVPVGRVARRGVLRSMIEVAREKLPWLGRGRNGEAKQSEGHEDDDWQPQQGAAGKAPASEKKPAEPAPANDRIIRVQSAQEYFDTLPQRFVPSAAKGVDAVFQWELTGEGGKVFHAEVKDGHVTVQQGPHQKPTVALEMDADSYVKVVNGELDGMKVFTSGQGKVKGSVMVAMKMRTLFPGA